MDYATSLLWDIEILPYSHPAKISYHTDPFKSEYNGHLHTASIGRGMVEVFSPHDTLSDYMVIFRGDYVGGLTDKEIIKLVRGGLEVGMLHHHINALKWILKNEDKVLNLYTLDGLYKENIESLNYLKAVTSAYPDQTEIIQLLAQVENVFAGNHKDTTWPSQYMSQRYEIYGGL